MWTRVDARKHVLDGVHIGAVSVFFFFVYEISRESLNGFAPNSHGSRVWPLAQMSLNVKVKDRRSRSPGTKTGFLADISGTAERFCAKFTRKTCLVPRSDDFEGQGQFRRPACGLCFERHVCYSLHLRFIMCSAARVVDKISTCGVEVRGVTSVDDELFVLVPRDDNQVAVYSIDDHQLLRQLNLPAPATRYFCNLTSCARHKCLYESNSQRCRIRRYDLAGDGATSKWSARGLPCGLSVAPGGNLFVTCQLPALPM